MDTVFIMFASMGILFSICLALVCGRALDPIWRIKQLRRFIKRNYMLLIFVSKDGKTLQYRTINADEDAFIHRGSMYVVEKGKIYRKVQREVGGKPVFDKEGGFSFKPEEGNSPIRYEEGVPVIYVDNEHIKPLGFDNEESRITPSATGAALNAWVTNQINKGLAGTNKNLLLFAAIIFGILLLANLAISYKAMEASNGAMATCGVAGNTNGGVVQNGTLIITQPKVNTKGGGYDVSRVSGL